MIHNHAHLGWRASRGVRGGQVDVTSGCRDAVTSPPALLVVVMTDAALPRVGSAGLIVDERGRILLGRRNKRPHLGSWVLPGGKIEPCESVTDALRREVLEETGLSVDVSGQAGVFEIINPPDEHRLIVYSWARPAGGRLCAGTDISELRFVSREETDELDITDFVRGVLVGVGWLTAGLASQRMP